MTRYRHLLPFRYSPQNQIQQCIGIVNGSSNTAPVRARYNVFSWQMNRSDRRAIHHTGIHRAEATIQSVDAASDTVPIKTSPATLSEKSRSGVTDSPSPSSSQATSEPLVITVSINPSSSVNNLRPTVSSTIPSARPIQEISPFFISSASSSQLPSTTSTTSSAQPLLNTNIFKDADTSATSTNSPNPIPTPSIPVIANPSLPKPPPLESYPHKYHVARTRSAQLPIYQSRKRGGNFHQTLIRKVTGNLNALRDDLVKELRLGEAPLPPEGEGREGEGEEEAAERRKEELLSRGVTRGELRSGSEPVDRASRRGGEKRRVEAAYVHPDTKTVGKGAQKRNRRASVLPGGGIAGEGKRVLGSVRSGGRTVKLQDLCWIKQECGHVLVKGFHASQIIPFLIAKGF